MYYVCDNPACRDHVQGLTNRDQPYAEVLDPGPPPPQFTGELAPVLNVTHTRRTVERHAIMRPGDSIGYPSFYFCRPCASVSKLFNK